MDPATDERFARCVVRHHRATPRPGGRAVAPGGRADRRSARRSARPARWTRLETDRAW